METPAYHTLPSPNDPRFPRSPAPEPHWTERSVGIRLFVVGVVISALLGGAIGIGGALTILERGPAGPRGPAGTIGPAGPADDSGKVAGLVAKSANVTAMGAEDAAAEAADSAETAQATADEAATQAEEAASAAEEAASAADVAATQAQAACDAIGSLALALDQFTTC